MPEGPFLFDAAAASDQSRELRLAELVREAVIRRTFQEVPHAVEVVIEDVDESRPDLVARARAHLGGDRLPEGDPHRRAAGA